MIAAGTQVAELRDGSVSTYHISPGEFGQQVQDLEGLAVASAVESANMIREALGGSDGDVARKAASMIALNAGATIYVSGVAATLADGVAMAEDVIATGQALEKLQQFIDFTQMMVGGET